MSTRAQSDSFILTETLKGNAFVYYSGPIEPAQAGANIDLVIEVGDEELVIVDARLATEGGNVDAVGYKAPTYTGGVSLNTSVQNRNQCSTKQLKSQLKAGATVTNAGTVMEGVHVFSTNQTNGGTASIAAAERGLVYVLAPNSKYLFRVTTSTTDTLYFTLSVAESNYWEQ